MSGRQCWHYQPNAYASTARCGIRDGSRDTPNGPKAVSRDAYRFAKAIARGEEICPECLELYRQDLAADPDRKRVLEKVENTRMPRP